MLRSACLSLQRVSSLRACTNRLNTLNRLNRLNRLNTLNTLNRLNTLNSLHRSLSTRAQTSNTSKDTDAILKDDEELQTARVAPFSFSYKSLRENLQTYYESFERRHNLNAIEMLREIERLDGRIVNLRKQVSKFYIERKALTEQLLREKSKENKALLAAQLQKLKSDLLDSESVLTEIEDTVKSYVKLMPNLVSKTSPDKEPALVKYICPPPDVMPDPPIRTDDEFTQLPNYDDFSERDHVSIAMELGMLDLQTASKVSGHAFYYLANDGVLLETALVQYALDKARQHGFTIMMPPTIMKREYIQACGFRPKDTNGEQQIYNIELAGGQPPTEYVEDEPSRQKIVPKLALTGTAEISLASWGANKMFKYQDCPIKFAGVNRSYRAEAGARGKRDRGLFRVHEFTKVELFTWVPSGQAVGRETTTSDDMLEQIHELQQEIVTGLGLYSRVLDMPVSDLGNSAYKKYDIEAWMPGRNNWGEITSASNCIDYQARRMNTKVQTAAGSKSGAFAHTLNGTAMAVPRVIVALIENYYDKERNAVWIPHVLRPYMGGRAWITKATLPETYSI
ncbi:hypothetical protein V1512DRAFT_259605 [Lipomyces arxii]|uniref:uncharacterized protein n=1 Tax=Lipomyces arxii TaxID=56418 RepID=UPI0034CF97E2